MSLLRSFVIYITLLMSFSAFAENFYAHQDVVSHFLNKNFTKAKSDQEFFDTLSIDEIIPPEQREQLLQYDTKSTIDFSSFRKYTDLRFRDTEVVRQIGPRCSAYGLVAGIENLLGNPAVVKLSQSHLFSGYRKYSSEKAVYAAKRMAITEYKYWPHERKWIPKKGYKKNAHTRLTDITYIKNDVLKAVTALDAGRPVYLGMSVTRSMGNCDPVIDPDSQTTGGGHAVNISGYGIDENIPGGGYFIIKNSWGKKCGDNGYQYMPFSYCMDSDKYCIMWDIQGVTSNFEGVDDVIAKDVKFNVQNIEIDVTKKKKFLSKTRVFKVKFSGDSRHIKQVDKILVSFKQTGNTFKFMPKVDEFKFSFDSSVDHHDVTVYFRLKDGTFVIKDYRL